MILKYIRLIKKPNHLGFNKLNNKFIFIEIKENLHDLYYINI